MTSCWPQCWRRLLHVHVEAPEAPDDAERAHRDDHVPPHRPHRQRQRQHHADDAEPREHGREVERVGPGAPVVVREELEQADGARLVGALGLDDQVARRPATSSSAAGTAPAASMREACGPRRRRLLAPPAHRALAGSLPRESHAHADATDAIAAPDDQRAARRRASTRGSPRCPSRLRAEERPGCVRAIPRVIARRHRTCPAR